MTRRKRYGSKAGPLLTLEDLAEAIAAIVVTMPYLPGSKSLDLLPEAQTAIKEAIRDYRKEMRQNALSRQERADLSEWLRTNDAGLSAMSIAGAILSWGGDGDQAGSSTLSWPVPENQRQFEDCCRLLALVPRWAHAAMDRLAHKSAAWALLADNWGQLQSLVAEPATAEDKRIFSDLLARCIGSSGEPPADPYKGDKAVREEPPAYGAEKPEPEEYPDNMLLDDLPIGKQAKMTLKEAGFATVGQIRTLRCINLILSKSSDQEQVKKEMDRLSKSKETYNQVKEQSAKYGRIPASDLFYPDERPLTDLPIEAPQKDILRAYGFRTVGELRKNYALVLRLFSPRVGYDTIVDQLNRRRSGVAEEAQAYALEKINDSDVVGDLRRINLRLSEKAQKNLKEYGYLRAGTLPGPDGGEVIISLYSDGERMKETFARYAETVMKRRADKYKRWPSGELMNSMPVRSLSLPIKAIALLTQKGYDTVGKMRQSEIGRAILEKSEQREKVIADLDQLMVHSLNIALPDAKPSGVKEEGASYRPKRLSWRGEDGEYLNSMPIEELSLPEEAIVILREKGYRRVGELRGSSSGKAIVLAAESREKLIAEIDRFILHGISDKGSG